MRLSQLRVRAGLHRLLRSFFDACEVVKLVIFHYRSLIRDTSAEDCTVGVGPVVSVIRWASVFSSARGSPGVVDHMKR